MGPEAKEADPTHDAAPPARPTIDDAIETFFSVTEPERDAYRPRVRRP